LLISNDLSVRASMLMDERLTDRQRVRTGFTLVELLVVVSIIAVLASLLLPALSQAKVRSRSGQCQSNQRQWGLALRMYVDEFGAYPLQYVNEYGEPLRNGEPAFPVWQQLDRYCGRNQALTRAVCPEGWPEGSWIFGVTADPYHYIYNDLARYL